MLVALAVLLLGACQLFERRDAGRQVERIPLAMVNGEPIYLEEFEAEFAVFIRNWDRFIGNEKQRAAEMRRLVLNQMIELKLLDQEARRQGVVLGPDEVAERVDEVLGPPAKRETDIPNRRDNPTLAAWGQDYQRRMLHERLINRAVTGQIEVTEKEVRAYYDAHKKDFDRPEQVWVRHIAVGTLDAYNKMLDLVKDGTEFEALARRYSITPDRLNGGDLGYVERGVLPPEFDAAIFSMRRIGDVSARRNPAQTQMGFHLFRLEGRKKAGLVPVKEAQGEIRDILAHQKHPEAYTKWLNGLKKQARIEIHETVLTASN